MDAAALTTCLDALCDSARELSDTALGAPRFEVLGPASGQADGHGAFVALALKDEAIQVGLLLSPAGAQTLSKSLLGMEPEEPDLPLSDVGDALCEMVNIVAGGLKRRVDERLQATLGLPLFVSGHPLPSHQHEVSGRGLSIGGVSLNLLLLTHKSRSAAPGHAAARS